MSNTGRGRGRGDEGTVMPELGPVGVGGSAGEGVLVPGDPREGSGGSVPSGGGGVGRDKTRGGEAGGVPEGAGMGGRDRRVTGT